MTHLFVTISSSSEAISDNISLNRKISRMNIMNKSEETTLKKKYVPHLPSILATCENNYACALKLLPDCDSEDLSYEFKISEQLKYNIKILDSARYTSTIMMSQVANNTPSFLRPSMEIRLYHDAKVAEVLSCQRVSKLQPSYEYPNLNMHMRNEKQMVNVFLAEWLHFCLEQREMQISTSS